MTIILTAQCSYLQYEVVARPGVGFDPLVGGGRLPGQQVRPRWLAQAAVGHVTILRQAMHSLCCSPVVFPVEDEEGRGDPRQVAVQLLQAAEEGHAQPQLHPARPAQLVAAQPRLTRGT